jgi:hypothetical protein
VFCASSSRAAREAWEGTAPEGACRVQRAVAGGGWGGARDALVYCATAGAVQSVLAVEPDRPVMVPALALTKPCVSIPWSHVHVRTVFAEYVVPDGAAIAAESTTAPPIMVVATVRSDAV